MQGEEIIGLVLQQGGTDVFGLALHFANFDRFVQFVGKDEVDFMLAFPVPKVPDVGVPTASVGNSVPTSSPRKSGSRAETSV